MTVGIGLLAFFGASALLFLAAQDYVLERRRVFRSLRTVQSIDLSPTDIRGKQLAVPAFQRVFLPAMRNIGSFGRRFTPANAIERLTKHLAYAGSPPAWDAERVLAFKLVGGGSFALGTIFLSIVGNAALFRAFTLTILMTAAGYWLPDLILRSKASTRQELIRRALPDSLDLLSITVEAGLGFDSAVARVARQQGGALGEELHRVVREMQLGKARSEALRDLADRSSVAELKSFVLSMVQAEVFGISVGKVLHVQANEMRIKRRQRAEERAQKIPVKIVFPLLFCIFPALFIVLMGPAAMRIYDGLLK